MAKRGRHTPVARSRTASGRLRSRRRRVRPAALLALVTVAAIAILAGFLVSTVADRDWHTVATVNGVSIDRATLRERMALDAFLAKIRTDRLRAAGQAGRLGAADVVALQQRVNTDVDPADVAIDELIDDQVLRDGARTLGVSPPATDAGAELIAATVLDARLHVRWVTLVPPAAPAPALPDPHLADALRAGRTAADIAAAASSSGWIATGQDRWLPSDGPVPTLLADLAGSSGSSVPASLLVAARSAEAGSILGPYSDDGTGSITVGLLVEQATDGPSPPSISQQAKDSGIDPDALAAWAQARALRRAVTDRLVASWASTPIDQVRAQELVLGAPPDGGNPGPYVELAHLVLRQLDAAPAPASAPLTGADLAAQLRALPLAERLDRFAALVTEANREPTATGLARSGEVGLLPKSGIIPAIGDVAFAPSARSGDILGPITTAQGDELFLLEARYPGPLDDATIAVLITARQPGADFAAMAARIDPALVQRARSGPWRSRPEYSKTDPASMLADVPVGVVSDPLVFEGELVIARVLERRNSLVVQAVLDRLRLNGLGPWLTDQRAAATIARDPDPLGSGSRIPGSQSEVPSLPVETPFLPSRTTPRGLNPTGNLLSFPVAP